MMCHEQAMERGVVVGHVVNDRGAVTMCGVAFTMEYTGCSRRHGHRVAVGDSGAVGNSIRDIDERHACRSKEELPMHRWLCWSFRRSRRTSAVVKDLGSESATVVLIGADCRLEPVLKTLLQMQWWWCCCYCCCCLLLGTFVSWI